MFTSHKPLIILSLALTLLISFDYLAAWTVPPSSPPSGNIAAPLNTSGTSQIKTGGLGVGSLDVAGGTILRATTNLQNVAPTINFRDTTVGQRSFWTRVDNNRFYILGDRNDDGAWTGESPWPLEMYLGAASSEDWVRFSNQVRANQYCDQNGANCTSSLGSVTTGMCPTGQFMRGINTNGTLACATPAFVAPTYTTRNGRVTIYGVVRPGNVAINDAQSIYSNAASRNQVCNILVAGSVVDAYADQAFGTNSEGSTIYSTGYYNGSSWQYRLYAGGGWGGSIPITASDRFLTSITCRS